MKKKYFNFGWMGRIIFLFLASAWLLIAYWLLWPYEPIKINDIKILNADNTIYAGDYLIYEVDYVKKHRYKVVKVIRQLVDGSVIIMKSEPSNTGLPLGHHKVLVHAPIPDYCYTSTFVFHLTAMYEVNPIRTVTVDYRTKPFKVRKRRCLQP
jgi:hypothetical protein